jgi:CheY-like chemotaxis protein
MEAKPTVLCIDDEEAALNSRRRVLESAGYRVVNARSGKDGLKVLDTERIDAVLLDYWMPEQKGLEVASAIRRLTPKTPIIVVSGYAPLPNEAVGLADEWFLKGDHPQDLLFKISELIKKKTNDSGH